MCVHSIHQIVSWTSSVRQHGIRCLGVKCVFFQFHYKTDVMLFNFRHQLRSKMRSVWKASKNLRDTDFFFFGCTKHSTSAFTPNSNDVSAFVHYTYSVYTFWILVEYSQAIKCWDLGRHARYLVLWWQNNNTIDTKYVFNEPTHTHTHAHTTSVSPKSKVTESGIWCIINSYIHRWPACLPAVYVK